jgi:HEAT repeat protein
VGLKDLFSRSGRGKSRVDRLAKRVVNQYAQSAERYGAMEDLIKLAADSWAKAEKLDAGAPERAQLEQQCEDAYVAVLKRFTVNASKTIDDEEEKGWLYRRLTAIGKPLLPAIKRFCLEAEGIAWALRIVEDVANESEEWDLLDALIEKHPPEYERDSSNKLQMLTHLREIDDPRVRDILARYLADPDENVRFHCIEALVQNGEEESKQALVEHLDNPKEDSLRLRSRIQDGLADLGWDLSEYASIVRKHVDEDHSFDGKKLARR